MATATQTGRSPNSPARTPALRFRRAMMAVVSISAEKEKNLFYRREIAHSYQNQHERQRRN
jgi:hypothetical protein